MCLPGRQHDDHRLAGAAVVTERWLRSSHPQRTRGTITTPLSASRLAFRPPFDAIGPVIRRTTSDSRHGPPPGGRATCGWRASPLRSAMRIVLAGVQRRKPFNRPAARRSIRPRCGRWRRCWRRVSQRADELSALAGRWSWSAVRCQSCREAPSPSESPSAKSCGRPQDSVLGTWDSC